MKDSGIVWIGDIPDDWCTKPVKQLFKIGRGRVIAQTELVDNGEYPVFSSQTQNNGCLGYINTYDFDTQQLTWTTDGANAGTVFLREGKHNCTNVCGTLEPKSDKLNLKYALYSLAFIAEYHKRYDTNGFKIMNNEMAEIKITFPPLTEQQTIADYLDRKCALIDSTIEKQKSVIEKLKLYKQSVITEAVTKGLDKNAKMKPSGIDWIGDIPEEWETTKIKFVTSKIGSGKTPLGGSEMYSENGIIFLRSQNIYNEGIRIDDVVYISDEIDEEMSNTRVYENDILLNITGGSIGRACIYNNASQPANVNQHVCIIRPIEKLINVMFLHFVIISNVGFNAINIYQSGANREGLNFVQIENMIFPNPSLIEQQVISSFLDKKCTEIDNVIENKQKVIDKLTDYKKSLIYECVTGKMEI